MSGFFGLNNYTRPGPGVSKDAPEKKRIVLFFELYFRKFWKLIQVNFLFLLACLPFFIPFIVFILLRSASPVLYFLSLIPLAGIGPAVSGMTYILRNFAREEHAFIWMDFWDTYKSNWKQSAVVMLINIVAAFVLYVSISFYSANLGKMQLMVLPLAFCIFAAVILLFMQYYLYTMIITFRLTLKQLYKNAFIFSVVGVFRNILTTLFCALIGFAACYFIPLIFVFVPTILLSTIGFIISFNSWPLIDRYMIVPGKSLVKQKSAEEDDMIFEDRGKEK